MEYVGTRWYKCDFHIHTTQSKCYKNTEDTAEDWILAVEEKGLNCVAVTDHNDYRKINELMQIGKEHNIVVFPGVEVTCDTSKIHMLIIFDVLKTEEKVRDFLSALDIDSDCVGSSDGTVISVLEVCKKAKERGALVIAAHIDEFNGLSTMSPANLKKILDRRYIDAVQVVNEHIWEEYNRCRDKNVMLEALKMKYGKEISISVAESWRKAFNKAVESKIPLLNFSDNPCEEGEAKHGLWGIGNTFSWLKMDENPNLESVRQALLSEDMRVVRCTKSTQCPEKKPAFWIKSMELENTAINPSKNLIVKFNPQLNTIIGGRGSGKSTIIRMLAGALGAVNENNIKNIEEEQKNFYKRNDSKNGLGVFTQNSKLHINLYRNQVEYFVTIEDIKSVDSQSIHLFKVENGIKNEIHDENFLDFFKLQVYTQKQIFEIAKDSEALLKIIDSGIEKMQGAVKEKDTNYEKILGVLSEIRIIENIVEGEGKVKTEIKDTEEQIEVFKESGISQTIEKKQIFANDEKLVKDYLKKIGIVKENIVKELDNTSNISMIDNIKDEVLKDRIENDFKFLQHQIELIQASLNEIENTRKRLFDEIETGDWNKRIVANEQEYKEICEKLLEKGVDITKLDQLLIRLEEKKRENERIEEQKKLLIDKRKEHQACEKKYIESIQYIRKLRTDFVESILGKDDNVKININPHRNKNAFELTVKTLLQKDNATISADIEELTKDVFGKGGIEAFRKLICDIRCEREVKRCSANFRKAIVGMDEKLYDKLISYVLEDEIEVTYRPEGARKFLPLSAASAGQKTTAILTFVLAYGEIPLLLDQPEDDLDNRLVYDLVVKRLKKAKSNRQLIIVTHNANIPVNGDAEYITSMESDTRYVEVKNEGTLDSGEIRKEICDVMEGTEQAFEMRAQKYHLHIVE